LDRRQARERLGLAAEARVVLAFGLISPYKGLELLVAALASLRKEGKVFTCVIAGRVKECQQYWDGIAETIRRENLADQVITDLRHVPDEMAEVYFKAADVLVMPYRNLFQSGVLFLAYRFGIPVIATDVGSLREDIVEGKTGFVARAEDPADLARTIERFFGSELYRNPETTRRDIRHYAEQRYSWTAIGESTRNVYDEVMGER
jgi:glycosyltransferase involved in cell wall biosynthesis